MADSEFSLEIRSTQAFRDTARVIGEKAAYKHLLEAFIAIKRRGYSVNKVGSVMSAFDWSVTPQGGQFWQEIHSGRRPENV